jgi:5-hydroxyisourate hydrolase-like protein (transthyretin family)
MAILSSHTLNGMNGSHAGGFPVRLINITQNSEIFNSSMDTYGRLEKKYRSIIDRHNR